MTNPTCSKRTLWSIAGLLFFATAAISFAHRDPAGGALWASAGTSKPHTHGHFKAAHSG